MGCARPLPKGSSSLWGQPGHLPVDYLIGASGLLFVATAQAF